MSSLSNRTIYKLIDQPLHGLSGRHLCTQRGRMHHVCCGSVRPRRFGSGSVGIGQCIVTVYAVPCWLSAAIVGKDAVHDVWSGFGPKFSSHRVHSLPGRPVQRISDYAVYCVFRRILQSTTSCRFHHVRQLCWWNCRCGLQPWDSMCEVRCRHILICVFNIVQPVCCWSS